ncbi:ArsR/SmtB family transcription factor [Burkholderia sp. TSV86]|uniref:ArsR/SmtB family transcription factor n=1 Tax=Burkholderia sp. TSV86 TaxID=1385594 RepID=UPI000758D5D8|nr:helix-turn-helix transcriptional regulator [Burkholderia sp. TSV86]KVE34174.1 ArsR family transcriptional regulator [Burkholderia sp. TSV86]
MPASDRHAALPSLNRIGALLADPGRTAMLWALMDGSARPAGELTLIAGLSPSAASAHLARLTDSGLLALDVRGRHRYYRIASPEVAATIEALANVAQAAAQQRPALRAARTVPLDMRYARTCYDHMAGELAVQVFDALSTRSWLTAENGMIDVTAAGSAQFAQWGIDVVSERAKRRRFACTCADWSERRPHLGGALGAALLGCFHRHGWIEQAGKPRVLRVTPPGQRAFDAWLTCR